MNNRDETRLVSQPTTSEWGTSRHASHARVPAGDEGVAQEGEPGQAEAGRPWQSVTPLEIALIAAYATWIGVVLHCVIAPQYR